MDCLPNWTDPHEPRPGAEAPTEAEPEQAAEREPLPAGHPVSWGALIAGTLLAGTPYPLPVFDR